MQNTKLAEKVFILIGADIIFNQGTLTSQIISCFHDILKEHYDKKNEEPNLIDMAFGC